MYGPDDYSLPERPLEPPAPRCLECEDCGAEIGDGETSVIWDNERLCMDCACERARDALDTDAFRAMIDRFQEVFAFDVETVWEAYAHGA